MLFEPLGWSIRCESSVRAMTVRDSAKRIYQAFAAVSDPDRMIVHLSFICLDQLYTSAKAGCALPHTYGRRQPIVQI